MAWRAGPGQKASVPKEEGQQLQRSPSFQPICLQHSQDAPLTATACSASGHVRSLFSDRCSIRREMEGDYRVSMATWRRYTRVLGSNQEIRDRKYLKVDFIGLRVQNSPENVPLGLKS